MYSVRKYTEKMYNEIERGHTTAYGGPSVVIQKEYGKSGVSFVVTHYGTDIVRIFPETTAILLGGWSATDQRIINDFFHLFSIPMFCRRHNDVLTLELR